MSAVEIIQKIFTTPEHGINPIEIKDHFATGCFLISSDRANAGLKLVDGALNLIGCKNRQHRLQIRAFVEKEPLVSVFAVQPHAEIQQLVGLDRLREIFVEFNTAKNSKRS